MNRLREWMHGKGQNIVIGVVCLLAFGMILHYVTVEQAKIESEQITANASPRPLKDTILGGDTIGPVSAETESEKKTSSAAVTSSSEEDIYLGFAGDICLDDTCAVMRHMKKKGGLSKVISPKLIQKMNSYDSMIMNNEFSISKKGSPMSGKAYTFRSKPANVKYLKQLGVDVAGLANNHIYDYGKQAFLDTLTYLKKAGIKTVGAGKNKAEAKKPV